MVFEWFSISKVRYSNSHCVVEQPQNVPSQSHDDKQFNNNCKVLILGSFDAAVVVVVVVKLDRVVEIPRFQKLVSCATEKNYVAHLKEQDWDVKKY